MKSNLTIPLSIKALNDGEFEGHGSIFGNEDLGGDVVMKGAFRKSLEKHREANSLPQMFWMHKPDQVPGKWVSMSEDQNGLRVKGVLADTPLGNEIRTLLKMDAVKGLSIGYSTVDQEWKDDGTRLLKEVELWEVSVVSLPMNPLAQVAHAKSRLSEIGEYVPTLKEFERILREAGCSRSTAKRLVHNMTNEKATPREAEPEEVVVKVEDRDEAVVEMSDEDIARAANEVAELMFAASIRKPRI